MSFSNLDVGRLRVKGQLTRGEACGATPYLHRILNGFLNTKKRCERHETKKQKSVAFDVTIFKWEWIDNFEHALAFSVQFCAFISGNTFSIDIFAHS